VAEIVAAARWAVIDLALMRDRTHVKSALAKLDALAGAAQGLAQAWSAVLTDESLRGSVTTQLRRTRPTGGEKATVEEIQARSAWTDRLNEVLAEDLWRLIAELRPVRESISNAGRFRLPEHFCVYQIARAWHRCIGALPTVTRNVDAASGRQASAFQRFMTEAAPDIGERIMRDAVEALRGH
jgi:hypothetical protein